MICELVNTKTMSTIAAYHSQDEALAELRRLHRLAPDEVEESVAVIAFDDEGNALELVEAMPRLNELA